MRHTSKGKVGGKIQHIKSFDAYRHRQIPHRSSNVYYLCRIFLRVFVKCIGMDSILYLICSFKTQYDTSKPLHCYAFLYKPS
jgi:hypothetical protein